jgi:hypothetical protein
MENKIREWRNMPSLRRAERAAKTEKLAAIISSSSNEELEILNREISFWDYSMVINFLDEIDVDRLHYLRVGGEPPKAWREHE